MHQTRSLTALGMAMGQFQKPGPPGHHGTACRLSHQNFTRVLQVPGTAGALALYLLPRYLLHNALDVPIQYKQQGAWL